LAAIPAKTPPTHLPSLPTFLVVLE